MAWGQFLAVSGGAVCAAIIIYAIYQKMSEDSGSELEIFETGELQTDDLRVWVHRNASGSNIGTYLFYGTEGRLMADESQVGKKILNALKADKKIFARSNDFIVQALYNEQTASVVKYRVITFDNVEKSLNEIFENNHFYSKGLIKLT